MRDHDTCQQAIEDALAHGHDGLAEWLATRCDLRHGAQHDPRPPQAREALHTPDDRANEEDDQ